MKPFTHLRPKDPSDILNIIKTSNDEDLFRLWCNTTMWEMEKMIFEEMCLRKLSNIKSIKDYANSEHTKFTSDQVAIINKICNTY